ncbi:MAG TPA: YggS family pyridoxal phosphate-dependent enzyme [Phycisphaerales bacterium]|nr:YggS family pyridoxal phosphate-dependent enzyme [Phycisphaerales bacterium]
MDTELTVAERYGAVRERVAAAARRAGRRAEDILLVAVTKYATMDQVRDLLRLGHLDLGESKAQQVIQRAAMVEELLGRSRMLPTVAARASGGPAEAPTPVRWHMIGHLQRNKVKKLIGVVRLVHSVDSLRLVEEIQAVAFKRDEPVDVLVQVNCSGERSKFGCAVAAAQHLCEQIDTMIHLRVRGLMTMAPYADDPEASRPTFQRCAELFDEVRTTGVGGGHFNILSMGMSNDYETAIECGANVVRVGSALFGERVVAEDTDEEDED